MKKKAAVPQEEYSPGATCNCMRCGKLCRVADSRRPDAVPFRLAKVPQGVCADCLITEFLYNTYPINMQLDQAGPELLLKPGIRDAFLMCGILEKADLTIDEIDWRRVVDNWKLPVDARRGPTNPYAMGDVVRQKEARREAGLPEEMESLFGPREEKLLPGMRMSGGTLIVDAKTFLEATPEKRGEMGKAVEGLLDVLHKDKPQ